MGILTWIAEQVGIFGEGVWSVASGVAAWGVGLLADLIIVLSAALPDDPFTLPELASQWETGLGWLNWWVPVGQIAAVIAAWAAAVVAFYAFRYILARFQGGTL